MKPIIGEVVSSRPVSLAEAASILSNFISKGTGATQEMNAYLARTSAAFDELVEYHRHVKLPSGSSRREKVIKEEETSVKKRSSKRLREEAFEGRRLISEDKTALSAAQSEGNGYVKARHDREEKSHRKKMKKRLEREVELSALGEPSGLKLHAVQWANGTEDNGKGEDFEGRDHRKKKKRGRKEDIGANNKDTVDGEIEQPPKKKKKKEKVVEYEVESERNMQRH